MSRIGNKEIQVPDGVTVNINGNLISVKGKLGQLERELHPRITVKQDDGVLKVIRASEAKFDKSLHGLSRTLVNNMIVGVSEGFYKEIEVHGVGYRLELKNNKLTFHVGFSHPVNFDLPDDITAVDIDKNAIKLSGIDKEKVGLYASKIRAIKPPDSYKGKGIRYRNERVKLKPGKSGA